MEFFIVELIKKMFLQYWVGLHEVLKLSFVVFRNGGVLWVELGVGCQEVRNGELVDAVLE